MTSKAKEVGKYLPTSNIIVDPSKTSCTQGGSSIEGRIEAEKKCNASDTCRGLAALDNGRFCLVRDEADAHFERPGMSKCNLNDRAEPNILALDIGPADAHNLQAISLLKKVIEKGNFTIFPTEYGADNAYLYDLYALYSQLYYAYRANNIRFPDNNPADSEEIAMPLIRPEDIFLKQNKNGEWFAATHWKRGQPTSQMNRLFGEFPNPRPTELTRIQKVLDLWNDARDKASKQSECKTHPNNAVKGWIGPKGADPSDPLDPTYGRDACRRACLAEPGCTSFKVWRDNACTLLTGSCQSNTLEDLRAQKMHARNQAGKLGRCSGPFQQLPPGLYAEELNGRGSLQAGRVVGRGDLLASGPLTCSSNTDCPVSQPRPSVTSYKQIKHNAVCQGFKAPTKLVNTVKGRLDETADCAEACRNTPGCEYFVWGDKPDFGKYGKLAFTNGACHMVHTRGDHCPEGWVPQKGWSSTYAVTPGESRVCKHGGEACQNLALERGFEKQKATKTCETSKLPVDVDYAGSKCTSGGVVVPVVPLPDDFAVGAACVEVTEAYATRPSVGKCHKLDGPQVKFAKTVGSCRYADRTSFNTIGSPLKNQNNVNECKKQCEQNPNCDAFDYSDSRKVCYQFQNKDGKRHTGNGPSPNLHCYSKMTCEQSCRGTAGCTAYSESKDKGCQLFDGACEGDKAKTVVATNIATDCLQQCVGLGKKCAAYSFDPNASGNQCRLFSGPNCAAEVEKTRSTIQFLKTTGSCRYPENNKSDFDTVGTQWTKQASPTSCKKHCQENPNCDAFDYNKNTEECYWFQNKNGKRHTGDGLNATVHCYVKDHPKLSLAPKFDRATQIRARVGPCKELALHAPANGNSEACAAECERRGAACTEHRLIAGSKECQLLSGLCSDKDKNELDRSKSKTTTIAFTAKEGKNGDWAMIKDRQECQENCLRNPSCNAFSFDKDGKCTIVTGPGNAKHSDDSMTTSMAGNSNDGLQPLRFGANGGSTFVYKSIGQRACKSRKELMVNAEVTALPGDNSGLWSKCEQLCASTLGCKNFQIQDMNEVDMKDNPIYECVINVDKKLSSGIVPPSACVLPSLGTTEKDTKTYREWQMLPLRANVPVHSSFGSLEFGFDKTNNYTKSTGNCRAADEGFKNINNASQTSPMVLENQENTAQCKQTCDKNLGCEAFEYNASLKKCWFYKSNESGAYTGNNKTGFECHVKSQKSYPNIVQINPCPPSHPYLREYASSGKAYCYGDKYDISKVCSYKGKSVPPPSGLTWGQDHNYCPFLKETSGACRYKKNKYKYNQIKKWSNQKNPNNCALECYTNDDCDAVEYDSQNHKCFFYKNSTNPTLEYHTGVQLPGNIGNYNKCYVKKTNPCPESYPYMASSKSGGHKTYCFNAEGVETTDKIVDEYVCSYSNSGEYLPPFGKEWGQDRMDCGAPTKTNKKKPLCKCESSGKRDSNNYTYNTVSRCYEPKNKDKMAWCYVDQVCYEGKFDEKNPTHLYKKNEEDLDKTFDTGYKYWSAALCNKKK